jgi:hypothetical protein
LRSAGLASFCAALNHCATSMSPSLPEQGG